MTSTPTCELDHTEVISSNGSSQSWAPKNLNMIEASITVAKIRAAQGDRKAEGAVTKKK